MVATVITVEFTGFYLLESSVLELSAFHAAVGAFLVTDLVWLVVRPGVDVGLGIDDHYWHDSYSMFGEARQARLAANLKRSASQYNSMELVRMLTIEGAEALGVVDEIGSLEPSKRADIILLDAGQPKFTPLTNILAQVANNAAPADVETVIVDGDVLMEDGRPAHTSTS